MIDRYVILASLGAGRTGAVYAAYDPDLDRRIALKLWRIAGELSEPEREALRDRLVREAQAMARLSHPHVVAVHDVGVAGGDVFVAMELMGGTLTTWLAERARSWREVRDVFLAAGSGLAAAHRAGLVHGDFTAENVLIRSDGRVGVSDFGMTSATLASAPSRSEPPTAEDDQLRFCAALRAALDGAAGVRWRGPPVQVARVLRRGLAADPAARYPSMDALLAALARSSRRRRWALASAAAVALSMSLALIVRHRGAVAAALAMDEPCSSGAAEIAPVWSFGRRLAIELAFRRTGVPYAAEAVRAVGLAGDRYAADWASAHTEACRATRVHGDQSEVVLDLRMRCLSSRRRELDSLAGLFGRADAEVVAHAAAATSALRPVSDCAHVDALAAPVSPPSDPGVIARLDALDARRSEVTALLFTGKVREGLPIAQTLAADAKALGHLPFEAKALLVLADLQRRTGDTVGGLASLQEAVRVADAGGDDAARARGLIGQVDVLTLDLGRLDDAGRVEPMATAVVGRVGDPWLAVQLDRVLGTLRVREGNYERGLALLVAAQGAGTAIRGEGDMNVWTIGIQLGEVYALLERNDDAERALRAALAQGEAIVGSEHPQIADLLTSLATVESQRGHFAEARDLELRALAIFEGGVGDFHAVIIGIEATLGNLEQHLGNGAAAVAHLRRAVAIAEAHTEKPALLADALNSLGAVLGFQGDHAQALAYERRALAIYRTTDSDHDEFAALAAMGYELDALGEEREAISCLEEALAGWQALLGPDHPHLFVALDGLAQVYWHLDRYAEAIPILEHSLRLRDAAAASWFADTQLFLGQVLWLAQRDRARAIALVRAANTALEPGSEGRAFSDEWLAEHAP